MFDFPSSPTNGQTVTGSGGQAYAWNGYAWTAQGSGMSQSTADARYVNVTGDAMTGLLSLSADPQTGSQAATKHYVDNAINLAGNYLGTWQVAANTPNINTGGTIDNANYVAVTANPAVAETVPAGVPGLAGQSVSNGDRIIWASSLSIWQVLRGASLTTATADGRYVQLAGSTMTGLLTLSGDPTSPLNPVTLQYLNAHSGGASITVSDTPPASPQPGALWWDSVGGQLYLYFQDANSSQWVIANSGGIPEAPTSGAVYARSNSQWTDITSAVDAAPNNTGRNLVHNGQFNIQQRGTGPWTVSGSYTADRWQMVIAGGDTMSVSIMDVGIGGLGGAGGNEDVRYYLAAAVTGSATAGSYSYIYHKIENVQRLSNKTVTLSFGANCAAGGGKKLAVFLTQFYGTGGSPSAQMQTATQYIALTNTQLRYSMTFTLPSVVGKTLGTNGDSSTWITFVFSDQGDSQQGAQTDQFDIWAVQLEYGSVATPLAKRDPADELALCQRFYTTSNGNILVGGMTSSGVGIVNPIFFPVAMRAVPSVTFTMSGGNGWTGNSAGNITIIGFGGQSTGSGGSYIANAAWTASADL